MKIGIIGIPKSGKTALARQLNKELFPYDGEDPGLSFIDGYVPKLEEEADLALDTLASPLGNVMIAMKRWALERHFEKRISCGTVFDTLAYTAFATVELQNVLEEDEWPGHIVRSEAILTTLAAVAWDTADYDYLFYLPATEDADDLHKRVDASLPDIFATLGVIPIPLLGTPDEQLEKALEVIKESERLREEAPTPDIAKRRVRPNREDSPPVGDSLEPVPDVLIERV